MTVDVSKDMFKLLMMSLTVLCQALMKNATDAMKDSCIHDFLSSVSLFSL